jgi:FHA domain
MTQNPGHDPGGAAGEPDDGARRDEFRGYVPAEAGAQRNGSARAYEGFAGGAGQQRPAGPNAYDRQPERPRGPEQQPDERPAPRGGPVQPGYGASPYRAQGYQDFGDRGGYPPPQPGYDAPGPGGYQDRSPNEPPPDQRSAPGYADHGYSSHGYPEHAPAEEGYRERGPVPEPSYQDPRYDGSYSPPAQPGAGYGGEAYAQQPGYGYPGYNAGYGRRDFGYSQGFDHGYSTGFTATLQLDDGSGRTYQLREGSNVVGRGQEAHFRLPDTGVSRRHFEIRWDGQVAMLGDLGSTNGTAVNGAIVQDWQLADGDVIRAGHSDIIVRIV